MEIGEFESLSKKVEQALTLIEDLKRERDGLKEELRGVQERNEQASQRVHDLVSRLDAALG